jgi:hypothetical protein|tara:strand:+ start:409 stop:1152 length:744 start_codon:yes stop_codon:yes gene_type:complete
MRDKFIINPVNGQYESTTYIAPDKKKKLVGFNKKNVGALDVASAKGRDILSEQLMYKWDSSSGKFFNGMGKSVDTMIEANKENEEVAKIAPGGEGKQFDEQFKRDKQEALKGFYPRVNDREFRNTLRTVQGKKKKLSDIDLLFSAADPKEKMEMRKNYKDYDFNKRMFKADIPKEVKVNIEPLKTYTYSTPPSVTELKQEPILPVEKKILSGGIVDALETDQVYLRRKGLNFDDILTNQKGRNDENI